MVQAICESLMEQQGLFGVAFPCGLFSGIIAYTLYALCWYWRQAKKSA